MCSISIMHNTATASIRTGYLDTADALILRIHGSTSENRIIKTWTLIKIYQQSHFFPVGGTAFPNFKHTHVMGSNLNYESTYVILKN